MAVSHGQLGLPKTTPVVLRLIAVNVGLWFVFAVLVNFAESRLALNAYNALTLKPSDVVPGLELWQVATYGWLHDLGGLSHILFNALGLYFLGTTLERRWGGKTFLKFFLLTGLIAGVFSVLAGLLIERFDVGIVGASGALFGIIAAFSILFPDAQILLFFVLPVRARYLVWIALGLDLAFFFAMPRYDVAIQTHMGGALAGWLLITGNWHPRIFWPKLKRLVGIKPKPYKLHVIPGGKHKGGGRMLH